MIQFIERSGAVMFRHTARTQHVTSAHGSCDGSGHQGRPSVYRWVAPGVGLAEVPPGKFEREMDKSRAGHLQENVRQLLNDEKSQLRDLLL